MVVRHEAVRKLFDRPAKKNLVAVCRAAELDAVLLSRFIDRPASTPFDWSQWSKVVPRDVLRGKNAARTEWALSAKLPKQASTDRLDEIGAKGASEVAARYPDWAVRLTDDEVAAFELREAGFLA